MTYISNYRKYHSKLIIHRGRFIMTTNINFEKVEEVSAKLDSTLNGISHISVLKDRFENALNEVISSDKVKEILDSKSIKNLNPDETISFFRVIFNQIKDESFNPTNFIIEEKPKTIKKPKNESEAEKNRLKKLKAINNSNVFHPKFKDKFLAEHRNADGNPYADETKRVAVILFGKVGVIEKHYNKDIYDFNADQFEEVLVSLKASTIRSLQNSISTLEQYIDFAIANDKTKKGNVATQYNNRKEISQFLNKQAEENMFFSKHDINTLAEYAENAQDGVILNLIFDGISHKNKFIELINLKIDDVDFDNMVINVPELTDTVTGEIFPPRQVPMSESTARTIRQAMNFEEKYVSLNGNSSRRYAIAQSEYILRGLRKNYQIKWENVNQRILRIANINDEEFLNATNIAYSGQVHYAKEQMQAGYSMDEAIRYVINRFNMSDNTSTYFYIKHRLETANKVLS